MPPDPVFDIAAIERWAEVSGVFAAMNSKWGWPAAEVVHFFGLCLLFGTVGMLDLRMLGLARGVALRDLHRLIPLGVAGWIACAVTGFLFVATAPGQYLYNPAFQTKMVLMVLAGVNVGLFYALSPDAVRMTGVGELPPLRARIGAVASLLAWLGVIACGRWITFFRPPYSWCAWCG